MNALGRIHSGIQLRRRGTLQSAHLRFCVHPHLAAAIGLYVGKFRADPARDYKVPELLAPAIAFPRARVCVNIVGALMCVGSPRGGV